MLHGGLGGGGGRGRRVEANGSYKGGGRWGMARRADGAEARGPMGDGKEGCVEARRRMADRGKGGRGRKHGGGGEGGWGGAGRGREGGAGRRRGRGAA